MGKNVIFKNKPVSFICEYRINCWLDYFFPQKNSNLCNNYLNSSLVSEGMFNNSFIIQDEKAIKSIEITSNSKIQNIGKFVFYISSIETLVIPASVSELENGWCAFTPRLNNVIIMPNNQNFKNYDDKIIIGKSDKKSDKFDTLIFIRRDVKTITVPPSIEIIGPSSFSGSSIESVFLSSHITKIDEFAFSFCNHLQFIEIPKESKLQTINKLAFYGSSIESISIPSNISELEDGWCIGLKKLEKVAIHQDDQKQNNIVFNNEKNLITRKTNAESDEYDDVIFALRNIKTVNIPKNIKTISSYSFSEAAIENVFIPSEVSCICDNAFYECDQLKNVEIPSDSKLQVIKKYAFSRTLIENIFIPSNVVKISERAFANSTQLKNIQFSQNSILQIIKKRAFICTAIEDLSIPSSVIELKEGWCDRTSKLKNVKVLPNNKYFKNFDEDLIVGKEELKSDKFNILVFASRNIKNVTIPSNIRKIASYSFSESKISKIFIPSQVRKIGEFAFSHCQNLTKIEILPNSELQIIEDHAFDSTSITSIFIPQNVEQIHGHTFFYCQKFQIIEFDENAKHSLIYKMNYTLIFESAIIMIPAKLKIKFNINKQ